MRVQLDEGVVLLCASLLMLFRFVEGGTKRGVMLTAHFDFPAMGDNIYGIKTDINQPLKGRNGGGRG